MRSSTVVIVTLGALIGVTDLSVAPAAGAAPPAAPYVPEAPYRAALVIDRDSGQVLFAKDEHLRWPPASMTKMMTLLIAMERVRDKAVGLDDMVTASAWASKIGGSQVYLREGERFPLRELLKAIVIASANDGAVAIAEYVAGSTDAFVIAVRAQLLHAAKRRRVGMHVVTGDSPDADQLRMPVAPIVAYVRPW